MKNPTVSVIMSVYNGAEYLKEAIESILNQTFEDFEFLIMDDGSQDKSPEILNFYAGKDKRIKLFRQENKGLTKSLNILINLAQGQFIARMDADDISLPERLEEQTKYIIKNPKCGLLGTGVYKMASNGMIFEGVCLPDDHFFLKTWLEKGKNVYAHGSVMIRKSALSLLDCHYRFRYGQDFDLFTRLSEVTFLGMVQKPLYESRISSESISAYLPGYRSEHKKLHIKLYQERKQGGEITNWKAEEEKILHFKKAKRSNLKSYEAYGLGKALFRNGYIKRSIKYFLKALRNPYCRKSSLQYLALSIFPSNFALRFQQYISRKMDVWAKYRINILESDQQKQQHYK